MKDALVDLYEELHQDVKEITGIETGYTSLNKMTCGLQEGDFVVLGARPSMGKTAFALNVDCMRRSLERRLDCFR